MKILDITGNPFSAVLNNGKTHEALFSAFDKNEICQLYTRPVANNLIDFNFCSSYYCVSDSDVLRRLTLKSRICGNEVTKDVSMVDKSEVYDNIRNNKFSKHSDLSRLGRDIMWHTNLWKNKSLKKWLEKEKPNVVFVDGGGECFLFDIALYVSNMLKLPLVSYFTDDYLITPIVSGLVARLRHHLLERTLQKVIAQSSLCYAISEEMANVYGNYFKRDFLYIMNSIEVRPYVNPPRGASPLKVSYFGSLSLNRDEMIARLAKILGEKFQINVYTFGSISDNILQKFDKVGIIIHNGLKGDDYHEAVYNSDILLHVESDDRINRAFTKLAVSTKIPEYLMHSRLVLGFGPEEVASMRLISQNDIGIVVPSDAKQQHIEKLSSCFLDEDFRINYSRKAYQYACESFDRKKNAQRFRYQIEKIIHE